MSMAVPEFPPSVMDRQSQAFRSMTLKDRAADFELAAWAQHEHPPLAPDDLERLQLPEDYESRDWDRGREKPKTIEEARGFLIERILDPSASDDNESIGAYDVLTGATGDRDGGDD